MPARFAIVDGKSYRLAPVIVHPARLAEARRWAAMAARMLDMTQAPDVAFFGDEIPAKGLVHELEPRRVWLWRGLRSGTELRQTVFHEVAHAKAHELGDRRTIAHEVVSAFGHDDYAPMAAVLARFRATDAELGRTPAPARLRSAAPPPARRRPAAKVR